MIHIFSHDWTSVDCMQENLLHIFIWIKIQQFCFHFVEQILFHFKKTKIKQT